jgi:hypothetical protein
MRRFAGSRLVLVSGLEALQLRLPWRSLKGRYNVNQDAGLFDKRRIARAQRRILSNRRAVELHLGNHLTTQGGCVKL